MLTSPSDLQKPSAASPPIDLRSEAVAPLHPRVRSVLSQAHEGSDAYDEDPSVHELEHRMAAMFGMGSALMVPTGRMANAMALGLLAGPGTEVLAESYAHLVRSEYGLAARLWGVQFRTFGSPSGQVSAGTVEPLLDVLENSTIPTRLLCVEDTHGASGGSAQNVADLEHLADLATKRDAALYCDGARLWYANAIQQIPLTRYGSLYDGLAVSLVKGIGAPCGAMLLMREDLRDQMREIRRMLGGALVRPAPLAKAALCALDVNLGDPARDCAHAAVFAGLLRASLPDLRVRQETNIVMFDVPDSAAFFDRCRAAGVLVFRYTPTRIRVVFHRGVTEADAVEAAAVICESYLSPSVGRPKRSER